jgi:dGTPase
MDWKNLLSWERLWKKDEHEDPERSAFQRDFDRIVFSSSFRRLQDKTQVFPMAESDYVRTRLTHSIEVSSVGRSLGKKAGNHIKGELEKLRLVPAHVGEIVAAACLAHDIGNPPFGHSGEEAIADWFKSNPDVLDGLSPVQREDLLKFEGNAQGFRQLTRLQHRHNKGGMQITHAVLGAFTKYPRQSLVDGLPAGKRVSEKKHGFFDQDRATFEEVAAKLGLERKAVGAWARHPLAFLVEAADDICYHIVDFEDGHRLGRVTFQEAADHLRPIAFPKERPEEKTTYPTIDEGDKVARVQYLRAQAIGTLIGAAATAFSDNLAKMLDGHLEQGLMDLTPYAKQLAEIKKLSFEKVYGSPKVVQIEAAGFEVVAGLLRFLVPAMLADAKNRSKRQEKVMQLVPPEYAAIAEKGTKYDRLLAATDFVSGMTDTYALSLYRKLMGMELPQGG